ncbi:hypothetical protein NC651_034646 [Populus alba x Populus x berolinensis]|nr:hypothetical protein NC651_034646 [Populus alba x Populus x berolinensis]
MGLRAYSLLSLNDLRDNVPRKQKTRKGRGIGSGKGKTAGRGHKGQKARGTMKFGFEGGQTPMRRRLPKRGFKNPFSLTFQWQPVKVEIFCIEDLLLRLIRNGRGTGAIGVKQIIDGVKTWNGALVQRTDPMAKFIWCQEWDCQGNKEAVEAAVWDLSGDVELHYNQLVCGHCLSLSGLEKKGRLFCQRLLVPPPKLKR